MFLIGAVVFLFTICSLPKTMRSLVVSEIYSQCCKSTSCFGFGRGSNCIVDGSNNCEILISYKKQGDGAYTRISFILVARKPNLGKLKDTYIAMGISHGPQMGDDLVVACKSTGGTVQAAMSYNTRSRLNNELSVGASVFNTTAGYETGGHLVCEFNMDNHVTVDLLQSSRNFTLLSEKYHILGAKGSVRRNGELEYHKPGYSWVSQNPVDLTASKHCVASSSDKLLRSSIVSCHIVFMVFAFVSFIPTAMLIGRFLKESSSPIFWCQMRLWHVLHFSYVGFAQVLVAFGFCLPITAFGLYNLSSKNALVHYVMGTMVVLVTICTYILGIVITLTDTRNRVFCKVISMTFIHWLLAVLAYSFGLIQLFVVPHFMRGHIGHHCTAPSVVVLLWVLFHIFVYLLLSLILYYREKNFLMGDDDYVEETTTTDYTDSESSRKPKLKKGPKKAKLYDDYYDDAENNRHLAKKGPSAVAPTDEKPIAKPQPKPAISHASLYDDFIDPPNIIVRQKKNSAGPSRPPPPPPVISDKDLDGIDRFTGNKSRNLRPSVDLYHGRKDPIRVFEEFPLRIRLGWANPNSLECEVIIGTFFVLSLIVSSELCYLLVPDNVRSACYDEATHGSRWFTSAW